MSTIYVGVVEDRHADTEVQVFATEDAAVRWAAGQIPEYSDVIGDVTERDSELTDGMKADGWVLYLTYSCEGDCVRVMRREVR